MSNYHSRDIPQEFDDEYSVCHYLQFYGSVKCNKRQTVDSTTSKWKQPHIKKKKNTNTHTS